MTLPGMYRLILLPVAFGLLSCSRSLPMPTTGDIAGQWRSDEVLLVRGSQEEVYTFHLDLEHDAQEAVTGHMDITYVHTDQPDEVRTIRQIVSSPGITQDGRLYLTGADPTLIDGPDLVGVYAPDDLDCTPPDGDRLDCTWGSDANGAPVTVRLRRP